MRNRLWLVLWPLLLAALLLSLVSGSAALDWGRAFAAPTDSVEGLILWQLRLPRALLALLVGAVLGLAGAALQGLLRNPLAEPALLGVTGCAALGAVLVFYFGLASWAWFALPAGGIAGAMLSVLLLFVLAGRRHDTLTLILAGVAINAFTAALLALALNFAPSPFAATEMLYWLLGSVANSSWQQVGAALPFMLAGGAMIVAAGAYLDALSLGEDSARSLGFGGAHWHWLLIGGVALAVGAGVAMAGSVGFVGLVVPHLLRRWVDYQPRRLLLPSAVAGAILLLLADCTVRWLPTVVELKLGVVTALVGAPFFMHLLYRQRRSVT